MAIRELQSVVHLQYESKADSNVQNLWKAGQVLAMEWQASANNTTQGLVRLANRGDSWTTTSSAVLDNPGTEVRANIVGLSADDTARTGNTGIYVDPVGSTYVGTGVGSSASFTDNTNGFYSAAKRALGDYQDERITNVTNLTDSNSGYAGPRRSVAVYATPSAQFLVDSTAFVSAQTATTNGTYLDQSLGTAFAPGDILTVGAGVFASANNFGCLVRRTAAADGTAIARLDEYNSTSGLMKITLLMSL